MALAEFFGRAAVAASQVLAGYNEDTFRANLEGAAIGVAFGADVAGGDGHHLVDMAIRLLARLYPSLILHVGAGAEEIAEHAEALALAINPLIAVARKGTGRATVIVGTQAPRLCDVQSAVFAGCAGWDALLSHHHPQPVGRSQNPFGAGAAAALACADVFASVFGLESPCSGREVTTLSTFDRSASVTAQSIVPNFILPERTTLIGVGAIGNSALWALGRSGVSGTLHLVDHEPVDLGNLQRYVLSECADVDQSKVEVAVRHAVGRMMLVPHQLGFAHFFASEGYAWDQIIVALDSGEDRRSVQAALPRRVVNAWTQPADLGVSEHGRFGTTAACLTCLYLPRPGGQNRHEIVAEALRITDRSDAVKDLLYRGVPVPAELLDLILDRFGIERAVAEPFRGRSLSELYTRGICAGQVVPLHAVTDAARRDVHVPVAQQSALAGVLLAAAVVRQNSDDSGRQTTVTRIGLHKMLGTHLTISQTVQPARRCFCTDDAYRYAYEQKYGT